MNGFKPFKGIRKTARNLLTAEIKIHQSASHVNTVAKPVQKADPLKEEVLEVGIDESNPNKTVRIGAYLADELKDKIPFLRITYDQLSWSTTDMKGIDPTITTHEFNVDTTFIPIR